MTYSIILTNIARHIQLTSEESQHFISLLTSTTLKRKQLFLKEGQIADSVAFVTSGCLRSYLMDSNGFEHILQFAPVDWWITDMSSCISGTPSILNIDALETSEILVLTRQAQLQLFDDLPKFERFFRIITEKSLVSTRIRLLDNLSLTAQQRYLNFCKTYPTLIHHIAQKQIAAYIGVTPEFLSKMKNELLYQ